MLEKMTPRLENLIADGKIRTKWSEIENYGIAELVYGIFDCDSMEDSVATSVLIDSRTVYLFLYEGIMYEHEGEIYNLIKVYIDSDNNLIFATPSGVLFLYETNIIDAEDPKYYSGND
jgi:hypothetical protein